jgi:hypothetical protein
MYWEKPGAGPNDFESDKAACLFQLQTSTDPVMAALSGGIDYCLRGKGWRAVKVSQR